MGVFLISISPPIASYSSLFRIHVPFIRRTSRRSMRTNQNYCCFGNPGTLLKKNTFIFLFFKGLKNRDLNRLTPNDPYMGRTALLTSKRCILYIYSTNISTEYFKHALYSPFLSLQNAVCFIMLTCLVPVLFTFYVQNVLKLKKIIPAPKG